MHIAVLAYACEPVKGSEPGTGWMWSRMLASFGEVTVFTRANNREAIESIDADPRMKFEYVDLPTWARFWKKGRRGARIYYLLWQVAAYRRARILMRTRPIDVAWHITLANAWLGSTFALLGRKFVFGPVSGGVPSCWQISVVGTRWLFAEVARSAARSVFRSINPLARIAASRASLILANNEDTRTWFPQRFQAKVDVFPNVVLEGIGRERQRNLPQGHRAIYGGELRPWKGVSLALQAMQKLPDWTLRIYGDGLDRSRLERITADLGIANRVTFMGWVDRQELFRVLREETDVVIFPSLHDEVGWFVAEALAHGVPVIALDRGGPQSLGATAVDSSRLGRVPGLLADAVRAAHPVTPTSWEIQERVHALQSILETRRILDKEP